MSASLPIQVTVLRPVYCENRKCTRAYPVGKARLLPGSEVSFSCPDCGHRTVKRG